MVESPSTTPRPQTPPFYRYMGDISDEDVEVPRGRQEVMTSKARRPAKRGIDLSRKKDRDRRGCHESQSTCLDQHVASGSSEPLMDVPVAALCEALSALGSEPPLPPLQAGLLTPLQCSRRPPPDPVTMGLRGALPAPPGQPSIAKPGIMLTAAIPMSPFPLGLTGLPGRFHLPPTPCLDTRRHLRTTMPVAPGSSVSAPGSLLQQSRASNPVQVPTCSGAPAHLHQHIGTESVHLRSHSQVRSLVGCSLPTTPTQRDHSEASIHGTDLAVGARAALETQPSANALLVPQPTLLSCSPQVNTVSYVPPPRGRARSSTPSARGFSTPSLQRQAAHLELPPRPANLTRVEPAATVMPPMPLSVPRSTSVRRSVTPRSFPIANIAVSAAQPVLPASGSSDGVALKPVGLCGVGTRRDSRPSVSPGPSVQRKGMGGVFRQRTGSHIRTMPQSGGDLDRSTSSLSNSVQAMGTFASPSGARTEISSIGLMAHTHVASCGNPPNEPILRTITVT